jgi:non-canonical (house-cleaning) NTP pyrophosphatase
VDSATNSLTAYMYDNESTASWTLPTNWVADASDPGVTAYANAAAVIEVSLDSGGAGKNQMLVTGDVYAGVNAASHVLASQAYSIAANTTYTLATNNTNQSLFPALANGVAVESGFRYEIEGTFVVSHTVTTITNGTVTDVLSTSFNTPSLTYGWMEYGYASSTTATFAAGTTDTITGDVVTTTLTNDAIANTISRSTTGTNSGYVYIRFRGVVKTSAAGNILPRIKFNYTDAGGVGTNSGAIQAGSWMRVTKVAETTTGWT